MDAAQNDIVLVPNVQLIHIRKSAIERRVEEENGRNVWILRSWCVYRLYWHPFEKNCKPFRNYIDYYVASSHHYYYSVVGCVRVCSSAAEASQSLISTDCVEFEIEFKVEKTDQNHYSAAAVSCHAFNDCVNSIFPGLREILYGLLLFCGGSIVYTLRADIIIIDVNRTICVRGTIDLINGIAESILKSKRSNFYVFFFSNLTFVFFSVN